MSHRTESLRLKNVVSDLIGGLTSHNVTINHTPYE